MSAGQANPPTSYRLGRYELRPAERVLLADDAPVKLGGRAFDMLAALAERHDRVVGKRELMDLVWPNLVVEENNLQAQIVALRKLLGPAAIATVPGRGYRLTLDVEPLQAPPVPASVESAQVAEPAAASPPPHRHNLPRSVEALIGRAQELAQLQSLLAAHRLVTVTGPGGVGKSRLVLDAAWAGIDRYADGVWLVELAALADPALVPSAVTTALAIDVAPAESPLSALTHRLGNAALLIVLDNCEHVIGAVAALLEAVLASAPNVHALVSSQELIGIGGEHVFRLPSLAVPAETNPTSQAALATGAVQLFVARAQAADPRFALDEHAASAVAAICRRLDGIPLALEMAAARVPLLGVDGLAARLDERFRVLTAGKRTALPRQRTLQATLDWSFGLLSPREQAVCRRLGVFAAPFALAAAAAVATDVDDDEFAVIESLAGLCDKSLVAADPGEGDVRYRLLDSTRAYALERLAAAQETAATMRRHALFLRRSFEHCFDDWTRRSDADFRTRYAPELDDLRSAIAWAFGADGEGDTAIALVASSVRLWLNLSLYAEIDALLRRAEERLTPATPPALRAELSLAAASTSGQRNHQAAIRGARTAAEIYRSLGDELRLGCALHALGSAHAGELDAEAESVLAEARPLLERTGRPRLRAMAHGAIALFHGALGRSDEAIRETHAALALYREGGADNAVLRTLVALADQYWQQGDLERAIAFAGDVLEQHRRSPFADRVSRDYATGNLCGMLVEHGELAQARELARPLLPELAELNILHGWTDHFASLLARGGRIADAVRLVGWADAIRSAKGLRRQPNEQRAREGVLAMANEDQSTAAVERLLAEGSRLDAQAACRLASP